MTEEGFLGRRGFVTGWVRMGTCAGVVLTERLKTSLNQSIDESINQHFIVRPKADKRAGQLSLPHIFSIVPFPQSPA